MFSIGAGFEVTPAPMSRMMSGDDVSGRTGRGAQSLFCMDIRAVASWAV